MCSHALTRLSRANASVFGRVLTRASTSAFFGFQIGAGEVERKVGMMLVY